MGRMSRYHMVDERLDWDSAEQYCRANSWRLAFIADKDRASQLSQFVDRTLASQYCLFYLKYLLTSLALFCIHHVNRVHGALVLISWTCYGAL